MPGAGKTKAAEFMSELGYPIISMGDVIRELAREKGLPINRGTLAKLMIEVRVKEGSEAVAKRCVSKAQAQDSPIVIVDGLRSLEEVNAFTKFFKVSILAILCSRETRFNRLKERGREDDPKSFEELVKRDETELTLGLGKLLALADYFVVNEGTKDQLRDEVQKVMRKAV